MIGRRRRGRSRLLAAIVKMPTQAVPTFFGGSMSTPENTERRCHRGVQKAVVAVLISACAGLVASLARAETVVDGTVLADERQGANWLSYGRTYSEEHYSPLSGINAGNVRRLGLAWFLICRVSRRLKGRRLRSTACCISPAPTGRPSRSIRGPGESCGNLILTRPIIHRQKLRMHMGAHRGVAYWRGKVYTGTFDGRLIAFDAKTGAVAWSVQTFDDPKARKAISGAPRVFNGKVIIGHGGGDVGTRGYVTAYDTESGKQLWRFYTVPGDPKKGFENAAMAMAAKTWTGQWWHWGGGGAVWNSITYDPAFNRVYLGTGNGNDIPEAVATRGAGNSDNLFGCSIVALDADTGKYIWHYQTTPGDIWDFDAAQDMVLANLRIKGQARKVLMQAKRTASSTSLIEYGQTGFGRKVRQGDVGRAGRSQDGAASGNSQPPQ